MKACGYCGTENDDCALDCQVCGGSLSAERPASLSKTLRWKPRSGSGRAIFASIAVVLVTTAVFSGLGLTMHHVFTSQRVVTDNPAAIGFGFVGFSQPVLAVLAMVFAWFILKARCASESHVVITTIATCTILALLMVAPLFNPLLMYMWLILPIGFITLMIESTTGAYLGVFLQSVLGIWMLRDFKEKIPDVDAA